MKKIPKQAEKNGPTQKIDKKKNHPLNVKISQVPQISSVRKMPPNREKNATLSGTSTYKYEKWKIVCLILKPRKCQKNCSE